MNQTPEKENNTPDLPVDEPVADEPIVDVEVVLDADPVINVEAVMDAPQPGEEPKKEAAEKSAEETIGGLRGYYARNCDEAWGQLKTTFAHPWRWVLGALGVCLALLLCAGLYFLSTVRLPSLPASTPNTVTPGTTVVDPDTNEEVELPPTESVAGERREGVYTILCVGTDAGGGNTDVLMLLTYDVPNQKATLLSIPRDTMVNVKWDLKKINSVYGVYGMDGLKKYIGKLVGFQPDYYVKVNLKAFVKVVDLIGGVTFDVPRNMDYDDPAQNLSIHLKKGTQTLNGTQAMGLVRWRKNNDGTRGYSDEERMKTQQAFLKAAAQQCLDSMSWSTISGILDAFYSYVESDLTLGEMLSFAQHAMSMDLDNLTMFTMPGDYAASAWSYTYKNYQSYVIADVDELLTLVNAYCNPYDQPITADMLDIMSINSDGSVSSSTGVVADSKAALPPVKTTNKKKTDEKTSAETTEPTETTEPVDPADPTDPTETTETTEPVDPAETTDPTEPVDPTEPSEPTEPTEPAESTDPTEPTETTEPVEPTEPTESPEPAEPLDPAPEEPEN